MKIGRSYVLHLDRLGPPDDPYMVRFKVIDCPLFAVRFHRIYRGDSDRHLHDHPWSFVSFVLWGGYREETPNRYANLSYREVRVVDAPAVVYHRAEDLHRLTLTRPALTLVFCGPRRRGWGFQTESGWVPWRQYLASPEDA